MTYAETLDYLYAQLPMFHRIGAAAYKADLENTYSLCRLLEHPEKKFKSVHIAGTNGKGSCSHMLAAILQTAGYKTGLYTSPHLKDFRERIRINGKMIPEEMVVSFVEKHKSGFEKIDLSFFEWTVGLCFDYFASEDTDVAVVETGLGGRLDSTNVLLPEVSVITNVSMDHMQLLGDTVQKIAMEKAGIIKQGIPLVIGEEQEETKNIFSERAGGLNSPIEFANRNASVNVIKESPGSVTLNVITGSGKQYSGLELDLTGNYQKKNIITVLATVQMLRNKGWNISDKHIYTALKQVKNLTGLTGRWHQISNAPLTICDVAHNESGIREVVSQISNIPHHHLHFILGVVNDKDVSSILSLLPRKATYYFCKANLPRALNADLLKGYAEAYGLKGDSYESVTQAFQSAKNNADSKDLVFVGGSTFVVAEVIGYGS